MSPGPARGLSPFLCNLQSAASQGPPFLPQTLKMLCRYFHAKPCIPGLHVLEIRRLHFCGDMDRFHLHLATCSTTALFCWSTPWFLYQITLCSLLPSFSPGHQEGFDLKPPCHPPPRLGAEGDLTWGHPRTAAGGHDCALDRGRGWP